MAEPIDNRRTLPAGLPALSRRQALGSSAAALVLAACGRPPELIGVDNPAEPIAEANVGTEHTVFIASTRTATEVAGAFYTNQRAPELGLASVDVHVPPNHVKGELERPRTLPPDPETEFAVVSPTVFDNDQVFIRAINRELAKRAPDKRDILVFVHGYNNTASDAILRVGQFVHDTGYQGVPVLFTWASGAKLTKYVYDLNSALTARPKLAQLAEILGRTNARGFDVFAHSMGAMLTVDSIVQMELTGQFNRRGRLKTIVLASPDIDIDLFESQLRMMNTARNRMFVLVSADDGALRVSRLLSGGVVRLGAADADRVAQLGVNVIDLTEIEDSASGSHSKFAGSPEVVQLIGYGLNANPGALDGSSTTLGSLIDGLPIRVIRG